MTRCPKPGVRKASTRKPKPNDREVLADTGKGSVYEARTQAMAHRQGYLCAICRKDFTYYSPAAFDHQSGRGLGGANRDDRIVVDGWWQNAAVHGSCNAAKGSKRYEWQYPKNSYPVYVEVKR